jgi:hypothetical protein
LKKLKVEEREGTIVEKAIEGWGWGKGKKSRKKGESTRWDRQRGGGKTFSSFMKHLA